MYIVVVGVAETMVVVVETNVGVVAMGVVAEVVVM